MARNMFLKVQLSSGPVNGESQVGDFKSQIELIGWSWGVSHTGAAGTGSGGSTGVATVNDLTVTAPLDKSFPVLAQAGGKGGHFSEAVVTICKATGNEILPYLTMTMTNGLVSGVHISGTTADDGTSVQIVNIALNFSKIEIEYTPQGASGGGEGSTTGEIDVAGLA